MSHRSIQTNSRLKPATWEDIKRKRDELEQAPIMTPYGEFDADSDSITRINNTLADFDYMPLSDGIIGWKKEDNSGRAPLTKEQLLEVRRAITARGLTLHYASDQILEGNHTVEELDNLALWGIE